MRKGSNLRRAGSRYSPGPGSPLEERSFLRPGPRAGAQEDQPVLPPSWSDVADGAALRAVPWKEMPPPHRCRRVCEACQASAPPPPASA